jgi:tape measure domain-containing protein
MTDIARFGLELVDKVTGPGRRAAAALDAVESKLKKTKDMAGLASNELRRLASGAIFKKIGSGIDAITGKLWDWTKGAAQGATAIGVLAGLAITKGAASMAVYAESARQAMTSLTGSAGAGGIAFERARSVASELNLNLRDTIDSYKKLLAMQFSMKDADDLVRIAADLRAVTGEAQSTESALRAITQIKAKGRLQQEELTGQLAEAGVATTLVYKELAKIYGKNEDQIRKMITDGAVDADNALTAIKRAIMAKVHEHAPGQAAQAFAGGTLSGMLEQLKSLPDKFFLKVFEGSPAILITLKRVVGDITRYIENIDSGKVGAFVSMMLDKGGMLMQLLMEFGAGFGEEFMGAANAMNDLKIDTASLQAAREVGRDIAKFFKVAAELAGYVLKVVQFLGAHPMLVKVGLAMLALGKLATLYMGISATLTTMGLIGGGAAAAGAGGAAVVAAEGAAVAGGATWLTGVAGVAAEGAAASGALAAGGGAAAGGGIMAAVTGAAASVWAGITAAVAGVSLALVGAIGLVVGSLGFLAYTIWTNSEELGRAWDYLADNTGKVAGDLFTSLTGLGEKDGGIPRFYDERPELSPQVKEAVANSKTDTTQHNTYNVTVNGGDPAEGQKTGKSVIDSISDFVSDSWDSLAHSTP